MNISHLILGCAGFLAWGTYADGDPLKFPFYRQEIVATFADAAAAAKAELAVASLPDGAARAFATRWDDAMPKHIEKAAMLERAGVKGDFYFNGRENVPVPPWAADLIAHGHAIGNHTLDHGFMYAMSVFEAYRQILLERIRLEIALGVTVNSYVSPFGWGGQSWYDRESKREVLRSVVETGHWVSCDNPLDFPEFPGDVWMPANRFSSNDASPSRELFEKGLRDQVAAADRNPLIPRIVLGTHSWCDEAGNALQEELLRKHCVRPDWVQLNDWDYGAYRYSALHAQARRLGVAAATARFSLVRYEPVSLASAIPLSVSFSPDPVSVTCGGRPLARGKNGTWTLPHDSDRAPRLAAVVSNAWNGVTVGLVPDYARRSVRVTVANGSAEEVRNLAVAVMTPPGCGVRRFAFTVPALDTGASCTRELAFGEAKDGRPDFGFGTALFAANADLDVRTGRVRIWAWTTCEGSKPSATTPREAARWTLLPNASVLADSDLVALSAASDALPLRLGDAKVTWSANADRGHSSWYNLTPQSHNRGKDPGGLCVAVLEFRARGDVSFFTNAARLDRKARIYFNGTKLRTEDRPAACARDGVNRIVVAFEDNGRYTKCLLLVPYVGTLGAYCPCGR